MKFLLTIAYFFEKKEKNIIKKITSLEEESLYENNLQDVELQKFI